MNWWDDPVFDGDKAPKATPQEKSPWRNFVDGLISRDWSNTGAVAGDAIAHGAADIPGYIGDAIVQPFQDLKDIPKSVGQLARAIRGKPTKEDIDAFRQKVSQPGPVSGMIERRWDETQHSPKPKDAIDRYVGAGARGVASMGPFLAEGLPAALSGAGMGVGGEAGHDIAPDSPLAPIIGSLAGGFLGAVAHPSGTGKVLMEGARHPDFPKMVDITIDSESRGNRQAVSPKGAKSEMQVMPASAKNPGYGIRPSNGTLADDARVGRQYLAAMVGKYKDPEKAWAAYNWGPGNLDRAVAEHGDMWFDHAPEETQKYVAKNMTKLQGGPTAPDGLPGNGSVKPIDPQEIAAVMHDPEAVGGSILDNLPPANREYLEQQKGENVVEFPQRAREVPVEDVLTPAEMQEMDASVHQPPSINRTTDRTDQFTPNVDVPHPVNDVDPLVRDQNPPAAGSIAGEQGPPQREYVDTPKSPEGHDDGLPPDEPPMAPEDRLANAIKEALPLRAEQEALYKQERAKRFQEIRQTRQFTSGEAGYHAALSKLKGELPTVPDMAPIHNYMSSEEINHLYDQIAQHPALDTGEAIKAQQGLQKLLGPDGIRIPTETELTLLKRVFPTVAEALGRKRPLSAVVADVLSVPRSIMASTDLSAALRQGLPLIHKKEYWGAFASMFKQLGKKGFDEVQKEIRSRKTFAIMEQSGLSLTDIGSDLTKREEAFMSNYAERIPVLGKIVKASDQAYVGFLNKLRADTFDSLLYNSRAAGKKLSAKDLSDISKFINTATGRGDLNALVPKFMKGEEFDVNKASPLLSGTFFSPRLMASRVEMLNPAYYVKLNPIARKEALKSLIAFTTVVTTVLGVAAAAGLEVETDPRSTDFARIKSGNTRYDVTAGFQPYVRTFAQLMTGQQKKLDGSVTDLNTGKFGAKTKADVLGGFLRNKEAPVVAFAHDLLNGQDRDFNKLDASHPGNVAKDLGQDFVPLVIQDMHDIYKDQGSKGVATAVLPDIFGVGVQTYTPKPKSESKKANGDWSFGDTKEKSTKKSDWNF